MYNNYHYIRHIRASAKCYKTRWFAVFVCCNERVTINTRSCFYPSRAVLVSKDEILCEFHTVSCFMIFIYLFIYSCSCRGSGKAPAGLSTEPRAGAEHRSQLLSDHLPGTNQTSWQNGHLYPRGRVAEGKLCSVACLCMWRGKGENRCPIFSFRGIYLCILRIRCFNVSFMYAYGAYIKLYVKMCTYTCARVRVFVNSFLFIHFYHISDNICSSCLCHLVFQLTVCYLTLFFFS